MTRSKPLGFAVVLTSAAVSFSAFAQPDVPGPLAGTMQVGYADITDSGKRTNDWSALGSVVLTLGGLNFQLDASKDDLRTPLFATTEKSVTGKGVLTETTTARSERGMQGRYGGASFWRNSAGILGVTIDAVHSTSDSYASTVTTPPGGTPVKTVGPYESTFENAGLFGEYFMLPDLTLRARGGFIFGDMHGGYGGVALAYYLDPRIAVTAGPDYANLGHGLTETDAAAGIEYMPFHDAPISLKLGYTYAHFRGLVGDVKEGDNIFGVSLKAYLGGRGDTLRDYQRNGASDWTGIHPALAHFGL